MIVLTDRHLERIRPAFTHLKTQRIDKSASRISRHADRVWVDGQKKYFQTWYTREKSNVGAISGSKSFLEIWTEIYEILKHDFDISPSMVEDELPGMHFDAKFIYTATLNAQLDASWAWQSDRLEDADPSLRQ